MRDTPQNQRESEVGSEKETDRVRAVKSEFRRGKKDRDRESGKVSTSISIWTEGTLPNMERQTD